MRSPSIFANNDNKLKKYILENYRVGFREVAKVLNISYELVKVLGMKRFNVRLVPAFAFMVTSSRDRKGDVRQLS